MRDLYPFAVGTGPAVWEPLGRPVAIPVPPGRVVGDAGPGLRYLRDDPDPASLTTAFPEKRKPGIFVGDTDDLRWALHEFAHLTDSLAASSHPWAHLEREHAEKACLQQGGPPGWWVVPGGFVNERDSDISAGLEATRDLILSHSPNMEVIPSRYKQGTNHGWPDGLTTPVSFAMHAYAAAAISRRLDSDNPDPEAAFLHATSGAADGVERPVPPCALLFNRSGHSRKVMDVVDTTGPVPVITARARGLFCRRRQIHGKPSAGNMTLFSRTRRLRAAIAGVPNFKHYGPDDILSKLLPFRDFIWWSDDISAFDQSVSLVHQQALARIVYSAFVDPATIAFDAWFKQLPVLSPPLSGAGRAFLYDKSGMTASGDLLTGLDGTVINCARIFECAAAAMGCSVSEAKRRLGVTWFFLLQGDDTVIGHAPSQPWDHSAYVARSEALGYKTKLVRGIVFLMHAFDLRLRRWAPLAARILANTLLPEFAPGGHYIALYALAARLRWGIATRVNPWGHQLWHSIRKGEPVVRFGIRQEAELYSLVASPGFIKELARELAVDPKVVRRLGVDLDVRTPTALSDLFAQLMTNDTLSIDIAGDAIALAATASALGRWLGRPSEDKGPLPNMPGLNPDIHAYIGA